MAPVSLALLEVEDAEEALRNPVLLLYGQRRTGKTSTLMHLPEHVVPDIVPLLVAVQGLATTGSLEGLARGLAEQIVESARRARNLTLTHPDADALRRDSIGLQRWMRRLERIAEGRTLLLCLDEFDQLGEVVQATGSRAPLNLLRYLMEHRLQWQLLFSGAHTPEELADYWSDYLINTRILHISYLDEKDARALIRQPIGDFPDIYRPETVDLIVELTRCQPFLVQLVCYEIVERLNAEERWEATPDDAEAVVPVVFEGGRILRVAVGYGLPEGAGGSTNFGPRRTAGRCNPHRAAVAGAPRDTGARECHLPLPGAAYSALRGDRRRARPLNEAPPGDCSRLTQ